MDQAEPHLSLLRDAPHFLFFTGKGGVGKTSIACACALALADGGKRVLLVSTDPASNLDEMLGVALSDRPREVPGASGLWAMNIDPDAAAEAYRVRVLDKMAASSSTAGRDTVREQLSGACTTEIAAFDEFIGLLAGDATGYEHVVFDTAPTGHTLRLLSLPRAWTGFLEGNERGASCLGPHSGLKMKEARFAKQRARIRNCCSWDWPTSAFLSMRCSTPLCPTMQWPVRWRASVRRPLQTCPMPCAHCRSRDPLLATRMAGEVKQFDRVRDLAQRTYVVPWTATPLTGIEALLALCK